MSLMNDVTEICYVATKHAAGETGYPRWADMDKAARVPWNALARNAVSGKDSEELVRSAYCLTRAAYTLMSSSNVTFRKSDPLCRLLLELLAMEEQGEDPAYRQIFNAVITEVSSAA